jgi:hypothetical protein
MLTPPYSRDQPVQDHRVRLGVDAQREFVRRKAAPADQQRPAGDSLGRVVAVAHRLGDEGAVRLLAAGQPPPQGGVHRHHVAGHLARQP